MNYFSTDYLIVYAFLLVTVIIGFRSGRNIQGVKDYILANRTFGKWSILLCYLATAKGGGSVLGAAAKSYSEGIIDGVTLASSMTVYILMGIYVLPKIANFKNCLTLGDLAATFYGEKSKLITGVLGSITTVCRAGMELIMLGVFCESLLGIQASVGIIVSGILLAIYSAYGGIRSVTATDIFHFLILLIVIPMLAYIVVNAAGGIETIFTSLPTEKLQIIGHKKSSHYLAWFIIWSFLPLNIPSNPATMQKFLMAKNGRDLMEQRMIASAFNPIFRLTIMLIGIGGFLLYPTIEAKNIVPHIIQTLLPTGMKGIAIIGLLAIMMSTICSYLHAVGFTVVHDIMKPLCDARKWHIDEVRWMRWSTLLISLLAIAVGVLNKDIYRVVLIPLGFSGPLLMFPMLFGIMGLKTDKRPFYAALVVTIIAFGLSEWLLPHDQHYLTILITTFANGITFFSVHVVKNKGFTFVNTPERQSALWNPDQFSLDSLIKRIVPTPATILEYSQKKIEKYGASYVIFGIFFTLNYIIPYFLWTSVAAEHQNLVLLLRLIGGILCGLLIVQEKWPANLLPYLPTFWHLTIVFVLPFTNTIMYLLSQGSTEWLISFMAVLLLLFMLVDWITALIVGFLGILLALGFYHITIGDFDLSISFTSTYLLIYQGIFGLLIGIVFARKKQLAYTQVATQRDYLKEIQEEASHQLVKTLQFRGVLLDEIDTLEQTEVQIDGKKTTALDKGTANYIRNILYRFTDYLRLEVTTINLTSFFSQVMNIPTMQGLSLPAGLQLQKHTQQTNIQADEDKLYEVFINSITYLTTYNTVTNPMYIILEDTLLGHTVSYMEGHTRQIVALKITITTNIEALAALQNLYMIDTNKSSTWITSKKDELPLVENARIIDAHYGYLDVQNTHTHTYVIPVNVSEVRGKVMELLKEPAEADPAELNHPLAIQLEKELLDKLQGTKVDIKLINIALDLIKKYHGGVKRKSGEPFFTHPISVALILLEHSQEQDAILGALLHDTIEDTSLTLVQIRKIFGEKVEFLVAKATNLEGSKNRVSLPNYENMIRIMNYEDPMAALVKLSDRLHNMRTIQHHPKFSKQKSIARETLAYFVPLAYRLGLTNMATELENLCQEVMEKKETLE